MVFVDLHLYTKETSTNADVLLRKFRSNIDYVFFLSKDIQPVFIQHSGFEADFTRDQVRFVVKKGNSRKFNFFIGLFFEVRKYKPSVVMMHSLLQPWLVILAALILGRKTRIIVQNHADRPRKGIVLLLQRLAGRCVWRFLFVSKSQTQEWTDKKIISDPKKVVEVMEGSTAFRMKDKTKAKSAFKCGDKIIFLWVGRLNANKDPLTVLKAFKNFSEQLPGAELWMIYGTDDLKNEVSGYINTERMQNVKLIGTLLHDSLEDYYNAADYFILGSHHEGSGYALCEAMACGCIPVVTDIPSFRSIAGEEGYLFKPGSDRELYDQLVRLSKEDKNEKQKKILEKFDADLSFGAIGTRISELVKQSKLQS